MVGKALPTSKSFLLYFSSGRDREIITYVFLDNGSELTFMSQKLADTLGLNGKAERLRLKWSNELTRVENNSKRVQPTISSLN